MNHYFRAFITLILIEAFTAAGILFAQTDHPVWDGSDSTLQASSDSSAITFPLSYLLDGKKVIPITLTYSTDNKWFTNCSESNNSCERLSELEVFKSNGELFRRCVFLYGLDRNSNPQLSSVQSWSGDGSYIKSLLFRYDSLGSLSSVYTPGKQSNSEKLKFEELYCNSTLMNISLDERGDCFMFDKERGFLSRVRVDGVSNKMILFSGMLEEPVIVSFADPIEDPMNVSAGTRVEMVTKDAIFGSLEKVEITPADIGLFNGASFLKRQSNYGGKLDFAVNGQHQIYGNILYVTETPIEGLVAHNNFNYGNFLWGVTAAALHIPIGLARLGAHINNFFLSPDSRGKLDSDDDQYSITIGHHWHTANKKQ